MTNPASEQILKSRDDPHPTRLALMDKSPPDVPEFSLCPGEKCSWLPQGKSVGPDKLRPRIEPWLTALCQSEHLSLLLGSGLSHAVRGICPVGPLAAMTDRDFGEFDKQIRLAAKKSAAATGRGEGNIEDQIRATADLLRGLEILGTIDEDAQKKAAILYKGLKKVLSEFAAAILKGEHDVASADEKNRENAFNYLVSFLMSFASRTGTRDRLHIFTTNYDRFVEAGAEVAGMHLLDRFVGSLAPIFRSSRLDLDMHYNPPGIRGEPRYLEGVARFTKLHGSVDWFDCGRSIRRFGVPFGAEDIAPYLHSAGMQVADAMSLMVYPNASKDRETADHPYVELFRDFAAATCRPNHTLIAYGYSFGDEHINRVIEDMLTIPSTHLVIISYDDPLKRIMGLYDKLGRHAQLSLLIGDHLGALKSLVDHYLPKPAIDRTTFRMAELLKARWQANPGQDNQPSHEASATEAGGEE
jgi:SIR2-like domain